MGNEEFSGTIPSKLPSNVPLPSFGIVPTTSKKTGDPHSQNHCIPEQIYAGKVTFHWDGAECLYSNTTKDRERHYLSAVSCKLRADENDILLFIPANGALKPEALYAIALGFHISKADILFFPYTIAGSQGPEVRMPLHPEGRLCADRMRTIVGQDCFGSQIIPSMAIRRDAWLKATDKSPQDLTHMWDLLCSDGACVHTIGAPLFTMEDNLCSLRKDETCEEGKVARIAFVNDLGFLYGAGIAHRRLRDAVAMTGATVAVFSLGGWMPRSSLAEAENRVMKQLHEFSPDYVVCGNLHASQCDNNLLGQMLEYWPVVFCLHDLWLLTGHCPYPSFENCEKATVGCDASCPCPKNYPPIDPDRISGSWQKNRQALFSKNMLAMANSSWTAAEYKRYAPTAPPPLKITLGCEDGIFVQKNKNTVRERLPLEPDDFVVFMPMCDFTSPYKGGKDGLMALDRLDIPRLKILCVGWQAEQATAFSNKVVAIPYVDTPKEMAELFQASDVVVSFSKAETLGQTMIEGAFCGVPSVAYGITGLKDAISDGVSGILCEDKPDAVASEVLRLFKDKALRDQLSFYAACNARNSRSFYASYKSLYDALEARGISEPNPRGFVSFYPEITKGVLDQPDGSPNMSKVVYEQNLKLQLKKIVPFPIWKLLRSWYHWSRR